MSNKADKRKVYSVAILVMQGSNWTLEANAFIAWSHDDARMKGLAWAKGKYPGAEGWNGLGGYHVQSCALCETDVIDVLVSMVDEGSAISARIAVLKKEIDEAGNLSNTGLIFDPPETDKLQ